MRPFPAEFRFGVATADHQCEAYDGHDDVRDVWERERKVTLRGRATDFWNRYREDADLARGLGCTAFRLSLSWSRLEPSPGVWSDEAIAHYRDVLQYMKGAGLATVVTLHHNTWPLHVQAAGGGAGMLDTGFPDRLAAYARVAAQRFGDLVDYWVTLNEPNQLLYGFVKPWFMRNYPMPPGLAPSASSEDQLDAVRRLIPNLFRAHARAREAIHGVNGGALVGANPLVMGLPRFLQRIADNAATRLHKPEDLHAQAKHLSQSALLDGGRVDMSVAQIEMNEHDVSHVLYSQPYVRDYAAAVALGSHTLLNVVNAAIREMHGRDPLPDDEKRDLDGSVKKIVDRGVLRAGIRLSPGLCSRGGSDYEGPEPELVRRVARHIFGDASKVEFVQLDGAERTGATRSWLRVFDGSRKALSMFATILGTNWWNLGMAGRLAPFLCPPECVGALDFVGLDYYWGVPSIWPRELERLFAAAECRYGNAPVWPNVLYSILCEQRDAFPGKRIVVIENGCVTNADDVTRADYITKHIAAVQRAVSDDVPIDAYLCWSITSNREWGLPFDKDSDFGLYHIELDTDPNLTRTPTAASERYAQIISHRSVDEKDA
ncbi:MAG: family 1 glycosylhydrolase [Candidatus Tyrphobacter sp.]